MSVLSHPTTVIAETATRVYKGIRSWMTTKSLVDGGWASAASIPFVGQIDILLDTDADDMVIINRAETAIATVELLLTRNLSEEVQAYLEDQRAGLQDIVCTLDRDYWASLFEEGFNTCEIQDALSDARGCLWRKLQDESSLDMRFVLMSHMNHLNNLDVSIKAL